MNLKEYEMFAKQAEPNFKKDKMSKKMFGESVEKEMNEKQEKYHAKFY